MYCIQIYLNKFKSTMFSFAIKMFLIYKINFASIKFIQRWQKFSFYFFFNFKTFYDIIELFNEVDAKKNSCLHIKNSFPKAAFKAIFFFCFEILYMALQYFKESISEFSKEVFEKVFCQIYCQENVIFFLSFSINIFNYIL